MRFQRSWIALAIAFMMMIGIVAYQASSSIKANELQKEASPIITETTGEYQPVNVRDSRIIIQEILTVEK